MFNGKMGVKITCHTACSGLKVGVTGATPSSGLLFRNVQSWRQLDTLMGKLRPQGTVVCSGFPKKGERSLLTLGEETGAPACVLACAVGLENLGFELPTS